MILEKGRERNEKSIVLIKDGIYQGYGFAPYQLYTKHIRQLDEFVASKKQDRDVTSIINLYLRKNKRHKIVEFNNET